MKSGMKQTVIGEIPADWKVAKLADTGQIVSGATPETKVAEYWKGEIAWCTPTDITALKGKVYLSKTQKRISELGLRNSSASLLPIGSLVICTRATLGDCAINLVPMTTNQGFKSIVPNEDWDVNFLYYLINNSKDVIKRLSSGSTFLEISKKAFENIDVPFPPLHEQRKIAGILSTVDEKIAVIDEQLAKTQEMKKGLMQRLLTKGIGHTAYKDSPLGEIPESWSLVKIADILNLVERPIKMEDDTPYELVTVKRRFGSIVPRGTYLGKDVKVKTQFAVRENDFVISKRQIVHCACGLIPAELDGAIVSNEYSVFNAVDTLDLKFFNYYVQRPDIQKSFLLSSDGVHIEKMLFKVRDWIRTLVSLPPISEQHQIAEILTTVDEKLQVLADKKAQYQELKRGLMQQLLTGQRRVRVAAELITV